MRILSYKRYQGIVPGFSIFTLRRIVCFFYDSAIGMKLGSSQLTDDPEIEGRVHIPYLSVIKSSVFEFNYTRITERLVGAAFNRVSQRPGSALTINRVSLIGGDIRSLNPNKVYLASGDFFPYIQYLNNEGYKIFNVDQPFYSGFKPHGKFRGAIISRPTTYRIAKISQGTAKTNGRLILQNTEPDEAGNYLCRGGMYTFYSNVDNLATTTLADLKLERLLD